MIDQQTADVLFAILRSLGKSLGLIFVVLGAVQVYELWRAGKPLPFFGEKE